MNTQGVERILNRHNPEHDVPHAPQPEISYAEAYTAEIVLEIVSKLEEIETSLKKIKETQDRLEKIEKKLKQVERTANAAAAGEDSI